MATDYRSTGTIVVITHANRDETSTTAPHFTPIPPHNGPSAGQGHYSSTSVAPALPPIHIEHNLVVASHESMTPPQPPRDADSSSDHVDGDLPSPHDQSYSGISVPHVLKANKSDDRTWLKAREAQHKLSHVQTLTPSRCSSEWALGSRGLNYHVNPDNDVYRWQTTGIPIPVGIDLSSFESKEQKRMIKTCLKTVLNKFNDNKLGPKFRYVAKPSYSAFFVRFGGDHPLYAHSFFPGSHPKDWYIDVFRAALTLDRDQEQFLMNTTHGNFAKARRHALQRNLVNILTHEMLHVVGVRHCDAQRTEMERCVRYPPTLSDDENNEELLMHPTLDWRSLRQLRWMSRTIQEIQQIYAMNVEERIGGHRIREVSWQIGAKQRKEIALRNARCCVA